MNEKIIKIGTKYKSNGLGICQNKECYGSFKIGVECRKMHLSQEQHDEISKRVKLQNSIKEEKKKKAQEEICKDYLYRKCKFTDCWRKHISWQKYKKTINCKNQERGICQKGRSCEYKHPIDITCKYLEKGTCKYNQFCRFNHNTSLTSDRNKISSQPQNFQTIPREVMDFFQLCLATVASMDPVEKQTNSEQ